ncbi:glycosyltransferase family 4 protein [Lentilactobacillus hilgardii]|uniref:glycosyltransferase family 4 protein n=1 Tax=Lentilactobacillus hilgardii TaxID=1588 RepID=UPI0021A615B7|nr:glycosyltransferase family 4 protein [Lentilactobacillus hilgardii]MCT3393069.1 glycosyltransferase [Lentilactobacillus hilgardii]
MVTIVHVENVLYKKTTLRSFCKDIAINTGLMNKQNINWFDFNSKVKLIFSVWGRSTDIPNADVIIATAWQTATLVFNLPTVKGKKFYFIQHYEIQHGHKDEVDETWKLPMVKIVVATWLNGVGRRLGVRSEIVRNFVDTTEYYVNNKFTDRNASISMLYHSEKWKGSEEGIEVINRILEIYPSIEVRLFGVPNRPKYLDDRILYYQDASSETLRNEVYNKTSIFIFPSHKEGWGLTATEAMLCGNALVATKNGGVSDFGIEGQTALLSNVGDVEELTRNVLRLIKDQNLRKKMQKNAVALISNYTINKSTEKFISILSRGGSNE